MKKASFFEGIADKTVVPFFAFTSQAQDQRPTGRNIRYVIFGSPMIIPLSSIWSKAKLEDPARRIDRTLDDRQHRLIAGLSVSRKFDRVDGALLVAAGHGKYLRVRHSETASCPISDSLRELLSRLSTDNNPTLNETRQAAGDLAMVQAEVFMRLKCRAGKYVDRILAIAATVPGVSLTDFDGQETSFGLCDPVKLSQLTGVNVIDDFPARDMAVGGNGRCLNALPLWLLFADRAPKVASQQRLVLQLSRDNGGYWLPASDGLDAELPVIRSLGWLPGVEFLDAITEQILSDNRSNKSERRPSIDQMYARGSTDQRWIDTWNQCVADADQVGTIQKRDARLVDSITNHANPEQLVLPNLIRSAVVWVVERVMLQMKSASCPPDQIFVAADTPLVHCLVNQLIRASGLKESQIAAIPKNDRNAQENNSDGTNDALTTGLLGLFHIDQMQGNVPRLTGASEQRILGRLTPGKPANWRQLLREMADFHPPAMKLRDAV